MKNFVESLIRKAEDHGSNADDALKYSQAALNAANAMAVLAASIENAENADAKKEKAGC